MKNIKTFENFNNQDIFDYIRTGDIESIKNYIDSGYDLNIWDNRGYTVLTKAAYYDNIEIVKLLLDAGVDINKENDNGNALIWATTKSNIDIIKVLLIAGYNFYVKLLLIFNINKQDHLGYTALIWAAGINNREVIEVLLTYGADVSILNKKNKSFYDYLNDGNKKYFLNKYPDKVRNAITHNYKKPFDEFVKKY